MLNFEVLCWNFCHAQNLKLGRVITIEYLMIEPIINSIKTYLYRNVNDLIFTFQKMDFMTEPKCSCLNLIFRCFMILCVVILIILSLYYYIQEDVILKTSYIEAGAELPSYTICFRSSR